MVFYTVASFNPLFVGVTDRQTHRQKDVIKEFQAFSSQKIKAELRI